jgi:hypothetical protein
MDSDWKSIFSVPAKRLKSKKQYGFGVKMHVLSSSQTLEKQKWLQTKLLCFWRSSLRVPGKLPCFWRSSLRVPGKLLCFWRSSLRVPSKLLCFWRFSVSWPAAEPTPIGLLIQTLIGFRTTRRYWIQCLFRRLLDSMLIQNISTDILMLIQTLIGFNAYSDD